MFRIIKTAGELTHRVDQPFAKRIRLSSHQRLSSSAIVLAALGLRTGSCLTRCSPSGPRRMPDGPRGSHRDSTIGRLRVLPRRASRTRNRPNMPSAVTGSVPAPCGADTRQPASGTSGTSGATPKPYSTATRLGGTRFPTKSVTAAPPFHCPLKLGPKTLRGSEPSVPPRYTPRQG